MNWKRTIAISIILAIAGCSREPDLEQSLDAISWPEIGGKLIGKQCEFQVGNLVPCPDEVAEFRFEIKAMRQGDCLYQRHQSFRRYDGQKPDPTDAFGMSNEQLVCATLVNGFAVGTYEYVALADDRITIRIDLKVTHGTKQDPPQTFQAEVTAIPDQPGKADAGQGSTLEWTFKPAS